MKIYMAVFSLCVFLMNCKNNSPKDDFERLVENDLIERFDKNINIEKLNIEEINDNRNSPRHDVVVMFNCEIVFTDNVYDAKGNLKFAKGMTINNKRSFFTYVKTNGDWKLTKTLSLN